jgi:hypothetical protein
MTSKFGDHIGSHHLMSFFILVLNDLLKEAGAEQVDDAVLRMQCCRRV